MLVFDPSPPVSASHYDSHKPLVCSQLLVGFRLPMCYTHLCWHARIYIYYCGCQTSPFPVTLRRCVYIVSKFKVEVIFHIYIVYQTVQSYLYCFFCSTVLTPQRYHWYAATHSPSPEFIWMIEWTIQQQRTEMSFWHNAISVISSFWRLLRNVVNKYRYRDSNPQPV